jgi:5-methylcytosine-specific restriction enzyme B
MDTNVLEPRLLEELKAIIDRGQAAREIMTPQQFEEYTGRFRDRFGPDALRALDGEALLRVMHGRQDSDSRCLCYWLEFKNDDEFAGNSFGGIGGGSALKFGVYQRQSDGAWMSGKGTQPKVIALEEAIQIARQQRNELLAGDKVLGDLSLDDLSDEAYARLQTSMEIAAPELSHDGWSHKYWFLSHPNKLDDYHSPRYQRFHLFKLLQMPPDHTGILDASAPRFICAGRFIAAASALKVPVSILNRSLNQRDGAFHRYWRVGTTEGDTGESQWPLMLDGGYVSIGWPDSVPDLSSFIGQEKVTTRDRIREWLLPTYSDNPAVASRKAGEILRFAQEIAENDLVLASEGQKVLGVGRVRGPYEYDGSLRFPHKRPVEWLLLESWQMPEQEGLRTTVYELGRSAENLLALEERLFHRDKSIPPVVPISTVQAVSSATAPLPPLDPIAARVDSILRRKGQLLLYGPPGTGKTYHALRAAKELAARQLFRKSFSILTEAEQEQIDGAAGLVRLCTFHPGYGYEDFIEGLRPETVNSQMVFNRRDGIFKRLCTDAEKYRDRHFFLVVDEINRGDVPRIFGELITVIEQDKRNKPVTLAISGSSFSVPGNVFLIGTMNTADRSISLLDVALRRRFGFIELMPDSSLLVGRMAGELPLGPWLDALNARLRRFLKRDARNLQIGHAYLLGQPVTSVAEFARVLREDIIPLLEEYCYDDFGTLNDILGSGVVDVEGGRIRDEMFESNKEDSLIQALSYEEMQSLVLVQGLSGNDHSADALDEIVDEDEDGQDSAV